LPQYKEVVVAVSRPFFRYTSLDAFPALAGAGLVALLFATWLGFERMPWWLVMSAFFAVTLGYVWNLQSISHNFVHNPYFANEWLNRAFSVLEALALGVPQILYHHYHMNHHFGDNDRIGADGTTKDWSSIYRYGKNDEPENFWKYIIVSFFRVELGPVIHKVVCKGRTQVIQLVVEFAAIGMFWIAMILVSWRYFLLFYLPSYYLGWVLSYAEGYLEHHGAQPGNPYANSVSSYHWLYNLLWFNNGYHQEHHWDPKVHWTRMKELHEQLRPQLAANHTRILTGPHMTGLLEDWWNRRREPAPAYHDDRQCSAA